MSEKIKLFFVFIIAVIVVAAMSVYQQISNKEVIVDEDNAHNEFLVDLAYIAENARIEYDLVSRDLNCVVDKTKFIVIKKEKYYYFNEATKQKFIVMKKESIEKIKHYAMNKDLDVVFDQGILYKNYVWYNTKIKLNNNEENIDYVNNAMKLANYIKL